MNITESTFLIFTKYTIRRGKSGVFVNKVSQKFWESGIIYAIKPTQKIPEQQKCFKECQIYTEDTGVEKTEITESGLSNFLKRTSLCTVSSLNFWWLKGAQSPASLTVRRCKWQYNMGILKCFIMSVFVLFVFLRGLVLADCKGKLWYCCHHHVNVYLMLDQCSELRFSIWSCSFTVSCVWIPFPEVILRSAWNICILLVDSICDFLFSSTIIAIVLSEYNWLLEKIRHTRLKIFKGLCNIAIVTWMGSYTLRCMLSKTFKMNKVN